jgi:pimeloyl-ACP methyl ester carboxylesterase
MHPMPTSVPVKPRRRWRTIRRVLLIIVIVLALLITSLFVRPLDLQALASQPAPAADYEAALARFKQLEQDEGTLTLNPVCHSRLLTHGKKTENIVVFIHGFTNCPQQWAEFADLAYKQGFNVLNMRMPQHGAADRLSDTLSALTAEQIRAFTDQTVDIAAGLGTRVTMVGLSGGGVVASWAGQNRSEVYRVVAVAPFFGARIVPPTLTTPAINLFRSVGDMWIWFDPELKENLIGPNYAYPRYSIHAVSQMIRFAQAVKQRAQAAAPLSQSVLFLMLEDDPVVHNDVTNEVADHWRSVGYRPLDVCKFDAALGLIHDMIDPHSRAPNIDYVYPPLLELISNPAHGPLPAGLTCVYGTGT